MIIKISEKEFSVDIAPLKERTRDAIMGLVQSKDNSSVLMRPAVKGACVFAMPFLGIKKAHRNDDPIELVCLWLVDHIFGGLETNGLHLVGEEIKPCEHAWIDISHVKFKQRCRYCDLFRNLVQEGEKVDG